MEFTEFLNELISLANMPVTILMGMVVLYWLMVILGVLGMDAIDLDLDLDADLGIDGDFGIDGDAGGVFGEALAFMHLGDVPVMIVGSLVIFFMWLLTVASNFLVNTDHSVWLSVGLIIPNIVISLMVSKALIWPFLHMFKSDPSQVDTRENMIGVSGIVKTTEITETFGQVEIQIDGPAIVINARTIPGERLAKGDCAKIVAYNSANDTFTVSLSKWEKI